MADQPEHNTTLVSITGENNLNLHILANLYHEPFDAESILSVVASLSHKPNVKWKIIYSTETWCTSMDQSEGGTLFVVSMEGELHIFQNQQWDILNLKCPDGLNAVWAANDVEAFAVGLNGEMIRVTGRTMDTFIDTEGRRMNAVHGSSPSNVWAVGDNGVVYFFDGSSWAKIKIPTNLNLISVLCRSEDEVYVGGAKGTLAIWNSVEWRFIPSPEMNITSMAIYQEKLYAAAGLKGVYLLGKKGLELHKELTLYRLKTIDDRLFGVGNRLVAQFDGTGWWGGNL
ncbi:MAG: hypothetical protein IMF11_00445, partial [Proteobacteria bacterium]|nr:hypothetical protein [Pseudomonadota bacterium]